MEFCYMILKIVTGFRKMKKTGIFGEKNENFENNFCKLFEKMFFFFLKI
jgi:hypothetical protein